MGSLFSSCIKPSSQRGGQRLGSGPTTQSSRTPPRGVPIGLGSGPSGYNPVATSGDGAEAKVGGSSPPLSPDREARAQMMAAKVKEREEDVCGRHTQASGILIDFMKRNFSELDNYASPEQEPW